MGKIIQIISVKPVENYCIELVFEDGLKKTISIKPFIKDGKSKELENMEIFNSARVDYGTLVFDNEYDFCPVTLREL